MDDLPFEREEFDIVWSEGAVYNMGFRKGVNYWKDFIKDGGILAVTELSWITENVLTNWQISGMPNMRKWILFRVKFEFWKRPAIWCWGILYYRTTVGLTITIIRLLNRTKTFCLAMGSMIWLDVL